MSKKRAFTAEELRIRAFKKMSKKSTRRCPNPAKVGAKMLEEAQSRQE